MMPSASEKRLGMQHYDTEKFVGLLSRVSKISHKFHALSNLTMDHERAMQRFGVGVADHSWMNKYLSRRASKIVYFFFKCVYNFVGGLLKKKENSVLSFPFPNPMYTFRRDRYMYIPCAKTLGLRCIYIVNENGWIANRK